MTEFAVQTLDDLLTSDLTHHNEESYRLYIVDTDDPSAIATVDHRSEAPIASFTSPYVDKTVAQVGDAFQNQFRPVEAFTNSVFIVMDEFSTSDESCIVVMSWEEDGQEQQQTLRTDFYVARQVATPAELGVTGLLENRDENSVYTVNEIPLEL